MAIFSYYNQREGLKDSHPKKMTANISVTRQRPLTSICADSQNLELPLFLTKDSETKFYGQNNQKYLTAQTNRHQSMCIKQNNHTELQHETSLTNCILAEDNKEV